MDTNQHEDIGKTIRAFIAIPLPDSVKYWITGIQKQMKRSNIQASWQKPENLHLTIKFLGQIRNDQIDQIKYCMSRVSEQFLAFSLYGSGIGVFPSVRFSRVLWTGIGGQTEQLESLVTNLEQSLFTESGMKKEKKRFSAHLTLARMKYSIPPRKMVSLMQAFENQQSDIFRVEKLYLIKSDLKSFGAVHKKIFEVFLKDK